MSYKVTKENMDHWYKEGTAILHREDGPAIEHEDGNKWYYLNDKMISRISLSGHFYSDKEMLAVLKLIIYM